MYPRAVDQSHFPVRRHPRHHQGRLQSARQYLHPRPLKWTEPYSVLSTQHSALSTQHSALSTRRKGQAMKGRILDLTVTVDVNTKSPPSTDLKVELTRYHRG